MSTPGPSTSTPGSTSSTPPSPVRQFARLLRDEFRRTVLENPYIPTWANPTTECASTRPSRKQTEFLSYFGDECLYGGAAAGGKTDAILMAALQYVHVPGYRALLVRRTFRQLFADDGLYRRLHAWLRASGRADGVHWDGKNYRFTFPSGATITYLYLDHEKDKDNFQGPGWQFIGVDELTQLPENWYTYLFSRLRKQSHLPVPLRMRAASNPGRVGHEWVKRRFVSSKATRPFVPARLDDNPGVDAKTYIKSMVNVDPIERAQLLAGDWDSYEGGRFKGAWFREFVVRYDHNNQPRYHLQVGRDRRGTPVYDQEGVPVATCYNVTVCDPASRAEEVNDYTAVCTFAVLPAKKVLVLDAVRERLTTDRIVPAIARVCRDFSPLWVGIEDSGFQITIADAARRHPDVPAVKGLQPKGKEKLVRATPAIIRAEAGDIFVPERGPDFPWLDDWLAEHVQFTGDDAHDAHDDQVDCTAYLIQELDGGGFLAPAVVEPDPRPDWEDGYAEGRGWQR
jgi:predicted phage terminase large subunit-like protein